MSVAVPAGAGAIFGQYRPNRSRLYGGPCHVLPTWAQHASSRRCPPTRFEENQRDRAHAGCARCYAQDIIALAQSEHLDAHANSIAVRFAEENDNENR
ncbi:MAG: hypothetical protein ACLRVN_05425 [Butyricicoccus sp.]